LKLKIQKSEEAIKNLPPPPKIPEWV
jgi:hypothetical protein